jgi:hypothetical protein
LKNLHAVSDGFKDVVKRVIDALWPVYWIHLRVFRKTIIGFFQKKSYQIQNVKFWALERQQLEK